MPETDPASCRRRATTSPSVALARSGARIRPALGPVWATTEECGFQGTVQQYQGGMMLWNPSYGVFVLYNDGRWERY